MSISNPIARIKKGSALYQRAIVVFGSQCIYAICIRPRQFKSSSPAYRRRMDPVQYGRILGGNRPASVIEDAAAFRLVASKFMKYLAQLKTRSCLQIGGLQVHKISRTIENPRRK